MRAIKFAETFSQTACCCTDKDYFPDIDTMCVSFIISISSNFGITIIYIHFNTAFVVMLKIKDCIVCSVLKLQCAQTRLCCGMAWRGSRPRLHRQLLSCSQTSPIADPSRGAQFLPFSCGFFHRREGLGVGPVFSSQPFPRCR